MKRSDTYRLSLHAAVECVRIAAHAGQQQEPGGWNRVVLKVADLPGLIDKLRQAGPRFRNEMETGPGGKQIQIEDPDGNPIELFEPAR